jgi:ABC-type sugar transport system ATPase subunit
VDTGRYAVIMGKTGIGKTTILEAICGLRPIRSGAILIHGTDVSRWSPADRNVGYTPQDLALFPTLNVREHLEFAMRLRRVPRKEMDHRVAELSELLGIGKLLERRIQGLSGGEAQRIALGRALSFKPSLLLLDEPLSALDATTRESMQSLLRDVNHHTGVTVLHVTHNQEDADALADLCLHLTKEPESGRVVIQA